MMTTRSTCGRRRPPGRLFRGCCGLAAVWRRLLLAVCTLLLALSSAVAQTPPSSRVIPATPDDYLAKLNTLEAGDTLLLAPGTYARGLPIRNLHGSADRPIVIRGPAAPAEAVLTGRDGHITISLIDASHLIIRDLVLDGGGARAHGIVAEGRGNSHTHHITLEGLTIFGFDAAQAFNGISTKAPAWNWIIRNNRIHDVGTGMYLGNSDGRAPFIAGLIEGNHVSRTLGYNLQIKHQLPRATLPGMPTQAQLTIIRDNVFDKRSGGGIQDRARPNLLLGHWPTTGPGAGDRYLVYRNTFLDNPTERLFQAEGRVAAYNNVFINRLGEAVSFQPHNDVPREIDFHYNLVVARGPAASVIGLPADAVQRLSGNRVFGDAPPPGFSAAENRLSSFDEGLALLTDTSAKEPAVLAGGGDSASPRTRQAPLPRQPASPDGPEPADLPALPDLRAQVPAPPSVPPIAIQSVPPATASGTARPTAPPAPGAADTTDTGFANSALARAASAAARGEFVRLDYLPATNGATLPQLLAGRRPDGSSAPAIDTWTDSGQWDPVRKKAYFQGLRQSNRFLEYDARSNRWREIDLAREHAPPQFERFGHLYGRTALDTKRGHFYRLSGTTLHRYHIDQDRWERFDGGPLDGYIPIDWHGALDMLVGVSGRQVHGFRDGQWRFLGTAAVHGYHSSAKYNPVRGDMLLIGGNHSRSTVDLVARDGTIRNMRDAPFVFSIGSDKLTHDPLSGNYLVLHRSRVLWEYAPDRDEWRVARDMSGDGGGWPFSGGGTVPFAIDELGVILWSQGSGGRVYRHASAFDTEAGAGPARMARPTSQPSAAPVVPSRPSPAAKPSTPPPPGSDRQARPAPLGAPPPTPATDGGSLIEREARTLQPGEWRNLADLTRWPGKEDGVSFKDFQYLREIDGGPNGADGMGWTQNLVYHRGKLMMLLMRDHLERALMVMEADGRFWRLNQPEGFDQKSHRRPFNKLTQDGRYLYYSPNIGQENLGRMIRTPLDAPGRFELYGLPIRDRNMIGQFAATYVPEWGRFYAYTPGGKLWSWADGEPDWTHHGDLPRDDQGLRLSGYAGLLLWNPVRRELAIVGGQQFGRHTPSSHKVYRITAPLGAPEMLEDRRFPDGRPMPWGSGSSKMVVDPRDGSYLVLRGGVLYRSPCAGGRFEEYEDLRETRPFGTYEPYVPLTNLPGTDVVILLSHIRGLILHRLKPLQGSAAIAPCRVVTAAAPAAPPKRETPATTTPRPTTPPPAASTAPSASPRPAPSPEPPPPEPPASRPAPANPPASSRPPAAPARQSPPPAPSNTMAEREAPTAESTPSLPTSSRARELSSSDIRALRDAAPTQ